MMVPVCAPCPPSPVTLAQTVVPEVNDEVGAPTHVDAYDPILTVSENIPLCDTPESCPVAVYVYRPMAKSLAQSVTWHDQAPDPSTVAWHEAV